MLELWNILPVPTDKDPRRYRLLLKADMAAVQALIRRFGALCGRPQRERGRAEYNYAMYLHRAAQEELRSVEEFLTEICPEGGTRLPPRPQPPSVVRVLRPETFVPPAPPAAPQRPSEAGRSPTDIGSGISSPYGSVTLPRDSARPAAPQRPSEAALPRDSARSAEAQSPPQLPPQAPVPPEYSPQAEPSPAESAVPASAAASEDRRPRPELPLWGLAAPLEQGGGFDAVTVGPSNRFAHAACMAVLSNPGTMYNPLFLHGMPGTGKTHMLAALGRGLEAASGGKVLCTTGARLGRAARLARAEGRMQEIEGLMAESKGLLVDDFHLLSVSEQNQEGLAAVLAHFFRESKPVAMASVYPPRALVSLEEALKFQIGSGWAVELKLPAPDLQRGIIQAALGRLGLAVDEKDAQAFQEALGSGFFELDRWLRRLRALSALRSGGRLPSGLGDLRPQLFQPEAPPGAPLSNEEARELASSLAPPAPARDAAAKRMVILFPTGREPQARYMLLRLHETARENSLSLPVGETAAQPYDPEQLYGIPFAVAEACDRLGADAALTLGPNPGSGLAAREGELQHAVEHLLQGLEVPLGWVPFSRLQDPAAHFRALLDLYPAFYP